MENTLPFMPRKRIASCQTNTPSIWNSFHVIAVFFVAAFLFTACKKDVKETVAQQQQQVSEEVLAKIKNLGFSTKDVLKVDGGYLVEGDILLTEENLNSKPRIETLRVGNEEQYRTNNTVLGLPRTISIRVSTSLPASIHNATTAAIARYNALKTTSTNFLLTFTKVTSGGTIVINPVSGVSYIASAGFPFNSGNPYNQILFNTAFTGWNASTLTTIIAHEIGHCIGFRHTDYMNRSFSCGGTAVNEGDAGVGAKHIPGTPTTAVSGSWMLACIGNGVNRPFISSDVTALRWLY